MKNLWRSRQLMLASPSLSRPDMKPSSISRSAVLIKMHIIFHSIGSAWSCGVTNAHLYVICCNIMLVLDRDTKSNSIRFDFSGLGLCIQQCFQHFKHHGLNFKNMKWMFCNIIYVFNIVCDVIINIKDKHDKTVLTVNMQLQNINLFLIYTEPDN